MTDIERAVNVGPVLGAELRRAGITTLEQLRSLGYAAAWHRLHAVAPDRDCANSCLALAGAIEGVRWMRLPAEVRVCIAAEARAEVSRAASEAAHGPD